MKHLYFIIIGLIIISCAESKKIDNKVLENKYLLENELDSLFNFYYNSNGPGAAILIVYNGEKIINKGYGLRSIKEEQPITPSTNLRSGSLAKQFTDLGILSLVENGKINLADTVFKYIPFNVFKNVTIEQLISHTSGIEDAENNFYNSWKSEKFVENQDITEWYKINNLSHFNPGTQFEYNNAAYCVLAKIIELNSGISYRDYIKKVIFDKVGMTRTGFIDMAKPQAIEEKALCYEKDSTGTWHPMEGHFLDNIIGPGGIYINLNDYYKYIQALRSKKILKTQTHKLIFKPISMDIELHSKDMRILKGKKSSYCMGWEVTDSLAVSAGQYNGVNNWVILELKRPLTIVILTNNTLLYNEKLVDKAYNIIDKYIKTAANK